MAGLAEHLKNLAVSGDVEAARIASDAITRLLGWNATGTRLVDLETARRKREE